MLYIVNLSNVCMATSSGLLHLNFNFCYSSPPTYVIANDVIIIYKYVKSVKIIR